ncbi:M20/M25/M40 family metallo-hydrolase [Sulfitobacter profundi]|uniref:M20/M25/M40 family metallo-hydrolase n=1 Tax=Sulfitobacter profundi TaxID=2679961 RepID=A0ABW1YZ10_9RHOB
MAIVIDKVESKGLTDTIGEELVRLIAQGDMKPGERLNEVRLAESFGVSRGPVREAARELEGQGLLVSRPRRGFYVANFTPDQIVDLYEVKRWIDPALIYDFQTYSSTETSLEILAEVDTIDISEKVAFSRTLFEFRQRLVARFHNRVLAAHAMSLYRQFHIVTALIDVTDPEQRMIRIVDTLRRFWSVMAQGDFDEAQLIMQKDAEFWRNDVAPALARGALIHPIKASQPMDLPLSNTITAALPDLQAIRRDLHRNPELSFDLPRTAGIVAERLRAWGFDEVIEGIAKTGVVGILHGTSGPASDPSQRVLLRADMDALPIQEATGAEHASQVEGRMHACGHDGHTTMLLGAAEQLAHLRNFDGTLVFCFQPAEELGGGAKVMIDEGLLQRFPVKAAYAAHNWPQMPVGQFGVIHGGDGLS